MSARGRPALEPCQRRPARRAPMSLLVFVVVAFAFAAVGIAVGSRARLTAWSAWSGLAATAILAAGDPPGPGRGHRPERPGYDRLPASVPGPRVAGRARPGRGRAGRRDPPRRARGHPRDPRGRGADPRPGGSSRRRPGRDGRGPVRRPGHARAGGGRVGATIGIRETRAVIVSGALAIAATAWIGRDLSQLAAQPVVFGLAYLAFAVAVAMRFGAIPFHLWAARLTDVVPETSQPILTALAPASLAVVALAWIDSSIAPLLVDLAPERALVLAIAIVSIILAAIAAFVQDDIEHILGYSIVGDAGVVDPRHGGPGSGGLGTGPDVDPGVRGRPLRVRCLVRRHPCRVLDRARVRPARLGPPLAVPGRRLRPGRRRRRRLSRGWSRSTREPLSSSWRSTSRSRPSS